MMAPASTSATPTALQLHLAHPPEGVPERFRRVCIHPILAPSGATLTDDFPADHFHHSGLFWRWPNRRRSQQYAIGITMGA